MKKSDYVPSHKREGFKEESVRVLRPYRDFRWTGRYFDTKVGKRRRDK